MEKQMRKASSAWPGLLGALLLSVTASGQDEVQSLADQWTKAYNRHDRQAIGMLYAENAKLMMHGAPTITGRKYIEEYWAEDFRKENPITVLKVTHSINGIDMILVHGNYEVIDRSEGVPLGGGRFAHIWTQAPGGGWLLDRDLWLEPFEPSARDQRAAPAPLKPLSGSE